MAALFRKQNSSAKKENGKKEKKETPVQRTDVAKKSAIRSSRRNPLTKSVSPAILNVEKGSKVTKAPETFSYPQAERKPFQEMPRELPDNYGDNQIYLLVRDPYWIYSYWEIQASHQMKFLTQLGGTWDSVVSVLRVYDITDEKNSVPFYDIVLQNMARSWYINTQPNRSYFVEIGLLHRDGRYICLARSNRVTTPRAGMSEVIDEQWMSVDFDKMYALSGGFQVGKSSAELQSLMEERFKSAISSGSGVGAVSSISSPVKIQKRGFFFWLECELIIYGGTEPDAKVTMQGRPVKLRPDGTFSFRYALPDGRFIFDCHAESSDGIEERVITPIVSRHTERPAPVFKAGNKVGKPK